MITFRSSRLMASLPVFAILFPVLPAAEANELTIVPRQQDQGRPVNHCAALGAGYVRVLGSNDCTKIGGHVRVEFDGRSAMFEPRREAEPSYPRASSDDGPVRAHLRLQGPLR